MTSSNETDTEEKEHSIDSTLFEMGDLPDSEEDEEDEGNLFINEPGKSQKITLIGNGGGMTEDVPEKYRNNKIKIRQYVEQRVFGYIQAGGKF